MSYDKRVPPPVRSLAERLRGEAHLIETADISFQVHLPPLLREAAREIDRLSDTYTR